MCTKNESLTWPEWRATKTQNVCLLKLSLRGAPTIYYYSPSWSALRKAIERQTLDLEHVEELLLTFFLVSRTFAK